MSEDTGYIRLFDATLRRLFLNALRISFFRPTRAFFILRTIVRQGRAAKTRAYWEKRGVHVPPFAIISITNRCNLRCQGCYARHHHRETGAELSGAELRRLIGEADELGISIILLAGGEPLTRPEILDIAAEHPGVVFPLFTNGLLLREDIVRRLRAMQNVIPILSTEGHQTATDARRGEGVYGLLRQKMASLKQTGVFFGVSLTVTSENFATVTAEGFVRELAAAGVRIFFYVDYVPVAAGTEDLVLTGEQRSRYPELLARLEAKLPGLFIALPGDEEKYGGCLAAGRGFIHINAGGRLEPCPFAPFSDTSLADGTSLREALSSPLLRRIRENGHELTETNGGCALWAKREWVAGLMGDRTSAE